VSAWGEFLHQISPFATALGGLLAAWYTYHLSKKKSDREGWKELYFEMKRRAEAAEHENNELRNEVDRLKLKNVKR
jgi:hypothetical protein